MNKQPLKRGFVRIIAGTWRSRRLNVIDQAMVRPTPDRVRETLFNWLAPCLPGKRCLDLFAGSGVLGFEALSRGASHTLMIDQSSAVIEALKTTAKQLKAEELVKIEQANIPQQLQTITQPFDIIFLDPPYQSDLLFPTCQSLEKHGYLANPAYIYLEAGEKISEDQLPENWQIIKQQKAGQIFYYLLVRREG
ncbi:MAG: 16S rRNA (guanine(966)-N(2))-methyltransferase RsmD [Gammaproteobacteria bacterium RIFCSPHIGHO2_12_FULL_42_10]|nr:MAG: 16S rRNA (guanine(966)-N(2))-methyltransferase RsmD [Gammaproteobacteria bacterium RIFCSPHIGHO2_12_FULL_42_10]